MIESALVLGGGSAGFLAAITLAKKVPGLKVRVVRSPSIGVIGVGEGTTAAFPRHLFNYLGLDAADFYRTVQPTWKLGIRCIWGSGPDFFYPFAEEFARPIEGLTKKPGFYDAPEGTNWLGPTSALMAKGKVFARQPDGKPDLNTPHAFHIENELLVGYLEKTARSLQVEILDATVTSVETGPTRASGREETGVAALVLDSGERLESDLYVDASGFRSTLLGEALGVGRVSYRDSLFCDRAVIGRWERTEEPTPAYTTAETMDHGWAWQIEHERWINRGYVFSSAFTSDDEAEAELRRKNPKLTGDTRVVGFDSYRLETMWSGNVVGIGNASGFVEPLEATALQAICVQCSTLADVLADSSRGPTASLVSHYNRYNTTQWDDIRDFLSIHFRYNDRLETDFWKACRADVALHGAQKMVDFYEENGPSTLLAGLLLAPSNSFGFQGYYSMLAGQRVPCRRRYNLPESQQRTWSQWVNQVGDWAAGGMDTAEVIGFFRGVGWWPG
ncbi:MAG: tryptophan 7-halogenase [Phycisphaerales bacterium JB063]